MANCVNYSDYTDERLAALAKEDPSAMSELTSRLFPSIRSLAAAVNPKIADDLLQEGLLAMLTAINSYDSKRGSVKTYVLTCARNRMLSTVKQNSLLGGDSDCTDEIPETDADDFAQRERFYELYSAMERCLTETERNVIGCYMTGRSYGEIAQTLGISVKSVDNAMQRSRKKLRREFDSKGIG
jgi:RNA polymerase sporulation-specific sigma factor